MTTRTCSSAGVRSPILVAAALAAFAACDGGRRGGSPPAETTDATAPDAGGCVTLFGRPNERTGLGADRCAPSCSCGGKSFVAPEYGEPFLRSLVADWVHVPPYPAVAADPYASPAPDPDPPGTVCAVLPGDSAVRPRPYALVTYASRSEASDAGARVTHFGRCGVCSTLGNLAVYARENDLTQPVRACGLVGLQQGQAANVACLEALGFDPPCAEAWYWDTVHTAATCLDTCVALLDAPYHLPDGGLNACLLCDEVESGPVFQAIAGRTRRNSGLPNAMCRPCSEVEPLVHDY